MRNFLLLILLMTIGFASSVQVGPAFGQSEPKQERASNTYSFSYTPVYQSETDLDKGGKFDVNRHYLTFDLMRPISQRMSLGLGLSYEFEQWNFNNVSNVAGATPWDAIHRPGISLPIFYAFPGNWTLGFTPTVQLSGESGAKTDESFIYGGSVSLSHPFGRNLYLGIGFGVFDQLDESSFFPFIVIKWQINDQFRISNPFRVGPAGPAGLEVVYLPADNWELGLGAAYRSYRFRLNDNSAVPNGVGQNTFGVGFLRVQRKMGKAMALDLYGGALFNGGLSIEDSTGDTLASDNYEPAPIAALTFTAKF